MWNSRWVCVLVVCLTVWGGWATAHAAPCEMGWQGDLARFAQSRYRAGAGEYEGLVYLWGGGYVVEESPPYRYLSDLQVYDPSINEWSTLTAMPEEKSNFGFAIADGYAYAIAGFRSSIAGPEYLNSCHRYNIAGDEWEAIADYPDELAGLMCGDGGDGKLYCFGWWDGVTDMAVAYVYNPGPDSWTAIADLPHWKDYGYATGDGTLVYITGGWAETGADSNTYAYDPATDSYTTMASPTGRQSPVLAAAGERLWLAGGCDHTDVPLHVYNQVYDGSTWIQTGDTMTFDRAAAASAYVPGFGVVVMGGWDDEIKDTRDVQLWSVCVPVTDAVDPADAAPGETVTITGQQFEAYVSVYLQDDKASYEFTNVTVSDATELTAEVPDGAPPGTYDLVVVGTYGQRDVLAAAFTVLAADDDTADDDTVDDDTADDDTVDDDAADDDAGDDDAADDDVTDDDGADDDVTADDDAVADDDDDSGGCGC